MQVKFRPSSTPPDSKRLASVSVVSVPSLSITEISGSSSIMSGVGETANMSDRSSHATTGGDKTSPLKTPVSSPEKPIIMTASSVAPQNPFETIASSSSRGGITPPPKLGAESFVVINPSSSSFSAPNSPTRSLTSDPHSVPASPLDSLGISNLSSHSPMAPPTTTPFTPDLSVSGGVPPRPMPQGSTMLPFVEQHQRLQPQELRLNNSSHHRSVAPPPPQQQYPNYQPQQMQPQQFPQYPDDDDENTAPSSEANTSDQPQSTQLSGSLVRFLEHTRKRLNTVKDDDFGGGMADGALISGLLQKLGRNGKWQTRWFETDGECLSYYKNQKRTKLLATLDLAKVGRIEMDPEDTTGCAFLIQVLGRLYHLRAQSRASCKDWVITLNRVKEARLQQGNVKLVSPYSQQPVDLLDQGDDFVTPRVVVVANRQRTRAVDETQEWDQMIRTSDDKMAGANGMISPYDHQNSRSNLGNAVLARWTKRRSSLNRLGAKLAKWARSLAKYRCTDIEEESVYLDRHVHPPGHDDKPGPPSRERTSAPSDGRLGMQVSHSIPQQPATNSLSRANRAFSTGSDDFSRMIA